MLRACLVGAFVRGAALVWGAGLLLTAPAFAQAEEELEAPAAADEAAPDAPDAPVAEPEPEVSDEPEPEVSEPEPEVSDGGADELGRAAAEPTVDEDLAEATTETTVGRRETAEQRRRRLRDEEGNLEEASAENRLASANPTAGLPWSMSIVYTNTITARTLRPNGQLTYNPYWNMTLSVRPRWNFTPALSLGLRQDVDLELTDAGLGTNYANPVNQNNQIYWQDTRIDVTYSQGLGAGMLFIPSMQVRLPTSPFSRGANRILGLAPSALLMRPSPTESAGTWIPGVQLGYVYWITSSNIGDPMRRDDGSVPDETEEYIVGNARTSSRCAATGSQGAVPDGGDCEDGTSTGQHQLALTLFNTWVPGGGVNVSVFYSGIWLKGAPLQTACLDSEQVVTASGEMLCVEDGSDTKWRIFGQFGISVGYDLTPYLTATLSYSTLAVHPDSDGNGIENPIWNENTTLGLSFQFRPSALAAKLRTDREEAAAEENGGEESSLTRPTAF